MKKDAKVLIVSWSPIPTPKYQKIEGSGQRFFGLANGLRKNGIKDITIAIGSIYPLDIDEVSGIKLFNYDFNDDFAKKLREYDTVILNYAIHGAVFITQHLPKTTQVIFDVYGPAYIESLAREPEDLVGTYIGNLSAVNDVFNKILPRGDYFLYANDAQQKFYTGVLATLGIINQFSYKSQRLLSVPFGIDVPDLDKKYDNPYAEYGIKSTDFTLLWFGGLYPWFDITKILDAIQKDTSGTLKLVIVGGNNPQNQHPDFVKYYKSVVRHIEQNGLSDRVILIDWVDYATRRKYYEHANAIISMNSEGSENHYSWRTRVMDYVGSATPLLTNGGDPLSDELLEVGAAFKITDTSDSIQRLIDDLSKDRAKLTLASKKMRELQPKYYWQNVTKDLARVIEEQSKPYGDEQAFRQQYSITEHSAPSAANQNRRSLRRAASLARKVVRKTREKGIKTTYIIVKDKVKRRIAHEYSARFQQKQPSQPRIIIVSNQLNNTGAPFVIIDVARQLQQRYPAMAKRVKFIAFTPIEAANVTALNKLGIEVEVYTNKELPIEFYDGDVIVFNSFAVSRTTIFSAINALQKGTLRKIFWYGHETAPNGYIDKDVRDVFRTFLNAGKAKVYATSEQTKASYVQFFGTEKNVDDMPYRFIFPEDKFQVRRAEDFDELRFISTGSLMDMRKGQYPILYALLDFYHNHYKQNPDMYRTFHVSFIGAYDKGDLHSDAPHIQNILKQFTVSAKGLDDHVTITHSLSHEKAIERVCDANVTICYSLYEALPIFVYEGMATGHPIIRNDSSGQEEQLVKGVNGDGFATSSDDFAGLVNVIESMMNKTKTTNEQLARMSARSNAIALSATKNSYGMLTEIANLIK